MSDLLGLPEMVFYIALAILGPYWTILLTKHLEEKGKKTLLNKEGGGPPFKKKFQ